MILKNKIISILNGTTYKLKNMNQLILSSLLLLGGISANAQHLLEALDAPNTNSKCIERVKDRNYGDGDHNFIYCAVQGPNGKNG